MLQLVLLSVLESVLVLLEELVLGLGELLLGHNVCNLVENHSVLILGFHFNNDFRQWILNFEQCERSFIIIDDSGLY